MNEAISTQKAVNTSSGQSTKKSGSCLKVFFTYCLVLVLGVVLTCSFAPVQFSFGAFIALIGFFYLLEKTHHLRSKLLLGYLFGVGFFATGVSWIYISVHTFSQSVMLGVVLSALFIAFLSLFFLIFGLLAQMIANRTYFDKILLYPVFWVLLELGRTHLFTGFPWLLLGYSQTNNFLAGYAKVGSVFLVGFIVCFISACLTQILLHLTRYKPSISKCMTLFAMAAIIISMVLGMYLTDKKWAKPAEKAQTISIIQGNFIQYQKWNPQILQNIIDYYYVTTEDNPSDLIFWSENSIPTFKPYIETYLKQIDTLGKAQNSAVLVGTVDVNQKEEYFNAAFVYGKGSGHYYKHHLVPFGEYYPFAFFLAPFMQYFDIPMSSFTKGEEVQPLLTMNGIPVALFICYESAYPSEVRAQLQKAQLIGVISDDAWFGNSLAPWQHVQIAQMRAIETERFVIQATNNGVSAIINPTGQIIAQLPRNEQAVLKGKITPMKLKTPWIKYGLYPLMIICLVFLITSSLLMKLFASPRFTKAQDGE